MKGEGLATGVGFFPSFFPASDAWRIVLNVGVAEFFGFGGGAGVSAAVFVATVGDDEGGFVGGEFGGELGVSGGEVDGAGDMTSFEAVGTIDIDEGDFFLSDGLFEVGGGDGREVIRGQGEE